MSLHLSFKNFREVYALFCSPQPTALICFPVEQCSKHTTDDVTAYPAEHRMKAEKRLDQSFDVFPIKQTWTVISQNMTEATGSHIKV